MRPPDTTRGARTWIGAGLAVVLVVLGVLAGVRTATDDDGQGSSGRTDDAGATDPAFPRARLASLGPRRPAPGRAAQDHPARGAPLRLVAAAAGVDAPVRAVGLEGDVLVPPEDVSAVGWWRGGAQPGSARGSALLAGHSWQGGDGVFDDLGALGPGDPMTVVTARGRIDYRVAGTGTYSQAELARLSPRLFDQAVPGRLVVITCSDYRDGAYRANTVVVARPVGRAIRE